MTFSYVSAYRLQSQDNHPHNPGLKLEVAGEIDTKN